MVLRPPHLQPAINSQSPGYLFHHILPSQYYYDWSTTSVVLYIMSRTGWLPTKPINQSYILNFPRYFLLQIRGSAMYNTDRVFNFVKLFNFPAGCISSNPTTRGHESSFVFYLSPHQASEVAFNREIGPGSKNEYPVQVSLINYIIILIYFSLIDILLFVLYVL